MRLRTRESYGSLLLALGLKKGEDGNLASEESGAKIVRRIYLDYLACRWPSSVTLETDWQGRTHPEVQEQADDQHHLRAPH